MLTKLTKSLASRLNDASSDDMLDVVFELNTNEPVFDPDADREERIAAMQAEFAEPFGEVERSIRGFGGEVTASAWINNSVRARIAARNVDRVAELPQVRLADVPHRITRD